MIALNVQLKNQYEGANVKFKIFPEGADVNNSRPLAVVWGKNEGGKASAEWKGFIPEDKSGKQPDSVKVIFTAESFGCEKVKSASAKVEIGNLRVTVTDEKTGEKMPNEKYRVEFENGIVREGITDKNGVFEEKDVPDGKYKIIMGEKKPESK